MRGSRHSTEFRAYDITATGVLIRGSLRDYDAISTGVPTRQLRFRPPVHPGLTEQEGLVLETIIRSGAEQKAEIAERTGLPAETIERILGRLVQLHYVTRQGTRVVGVARPGG